MRLKAALHTHTACSDGELDLARGRPTITNWKGFDGCVHDENDWTLTKELSDRALSGDHRRRARLTLTGMDNDVETLAIGNRPDPRGPGRESYHRGPMDRVRRQYVPDLSAAAASITVRDVAFIVEHPTLERESA